MIIDFHAHMFPPDFISRRGSLCDDPDFKLLYADPKSRMADHQQLLENMDRESVEKTVVMGFPWKNEKRCREQNAYFSDVMKESGGRIIPFGMMPLIQSTEVEQWVENMHKAGLKGIGEVAFYTEGMNNSSIDLLRRILSASIIFDMPVCLHVNEPIGHKYPGKYDPELPLLYSVLEESQQATVILSHWGGGLLFYELMHEVKKVLKNVYYDTAASPFLYDDSIYKTAVDIIGSKKILFGSDYPLISSERYINAIESSKINKDDKYNLLKGNAVRILNLSI